MTSQASREQTRHTDGKNHKQIAKASTVRMVSADNSDESDDEGVSREMLLLSLLLLGSLVPLITTHRIVTLLPLSTQT
jgi:hypothetical protein